MHQLWRLSLLVPGLDRGMGSSAERAVQAEGHAPGPRRARMSETCEGRALLHHGLGGRRCRPGSPRTDEHQRPHPRLQLSNANAIINIEAALPENRKRGSRAKPLACDGALPSGCINFHVDRQETA